MWLKSEISKYSCSFTCEEWSHNCDVTQWFVASVFSCEFVWNSICVIFAFVWETFWHGSFKTVKDPIVWYTRLINHFRVFGISILLGKIPPCKNWNLTYEKFLVFMAWIICRFWKKYRTLNSTHVSRGFQHQHLYMLFVEITTIRHITPTKY